MKRAWRLLKACRELNNTPTAIIADMSYIIVCVIFFTYLASKIMLILSSRVYELNTGKNLSSFSMMIVLLIIKNIYTGFFEDKRESTKNNLRALTIHLPISKKDFILAQYIGSIYLFLPAFIFMLSLIILSIVGEKSLIYQFELGTVLLGFGLTYSIVSLEKGLLTYYYLDPRIREVSYLAITLLWMMVNYFIEVEETGQVARIVDCKQGRLWFQGICSLGGVNSVFLMLFIILIGYWCQMRLPIMLERRKQ